MATKEETSIVPLLKKETAPVIKLANNIEIVDAPSMEKAATFLNNTNEILDRVVAYKESKTKPLNEALKIIRAETKPLETALETAIDTVRGKMSVYQTEAKKIADKAAEDIANRVGEGKGKLKPETAVKKIDELERPAGTLDAGAGQVKFRTVKKFEVTNFDVLSDEFKLADEVKIRKAMLAGIEIKGVRYYEVQEAANFRG